MKAKHKTKVFSRTEIALSVTIDRAINNKGNGQEEIITVDDRGIVIITYDINTTWNVIGNKSETI